MRSLSIFAVLTLGSTLFAGACESEPGTDNGNTGGTSGANEAGGGAGDGDSVNKCEQLCSRAASAGCTDTDPAKCLTACNELKSNAAATCASEAEAVISCGINETYSCVDGEAKVQGCDTQLEALLACSNGSGSECGGGSDPGDPSDPGPAPTDVAGSAGCEAYCEQAETQCSATCTPTTCKIEAGHCAASTEDFLLCQAQTGTWYCGADGYSIVHNCKYDESLCDGSAPSGPTCEVPEVAPSNGSCYTGGACNPVTNEGCTDGAGCDISNDGFQCFPPPADATLCGACDPSSGPFCGPGTTCADKCARFCCTNADCGCGTCVDTLLGGTTVKLCMGE